MPKHIPHFAVVTTSRADYGLLKPLLDALNASDQHQCALLVTGSHLSQHHGYTIDAIKADGMPIAKAIELLPENDTPVAVSRAVAKGMDGFAQAYDELSPDAIIVLGDRHELMAACTPAVLQRVPIVHLHGGEVTAAAVDDAFRHAVSKMAAVHFTSHQVYTKRLLAMGEFGERVHTVGAIGLDAIRTVPVMTVEELSQSVGVDFSQPVALLTYHPVTLDDVSAAESQINTVINACKQFPELQWVITKPNIDAGNTAIIQALEVFRATNPAKVKLVANLGQQRYLSTLAHAAVMVGNSSSGIIESASYRLPTVNIGDRQAGRECPDNVMNTPCETDAIVSAIQHATSPAFEEQLATMVNPYGDGRAVERMMTVLKHINWQDKATLLKKGFADLPQ